jgi:hypothetical protein
MFSGQEFWGPLPPSNATGEELLNWRMPARPVFMNSDLVASGLTIRSVESTEQGMYRITIDVTPTDRMVWHVSDIPGWAKPGTKVTLIVTQQGKP